MSKLHWMVEPRGDSIETRIVSEILKDVTDRRGWRQEWDQFDDDIKREIIEKWVQLVRNEMNGEHG